MASSLRKLTAAGKKKSMHLSNYLSNCLRVAASETPTRSVTHILAGTSASHKRSIEGRTSTTRSAAFVSSSSSLTQRETPENLSSRNIGSTLVISSVAIMWRAFIDCKGVIRNEPQSYLIFLVVSDLLCIKRPPLNFLSNCISHSTVGVEHNVQISNCIMIHVLVMDCGKLQI